MPPPPPLPPPYHVAPPVTDNGELLFGNATELILIDPENLNQNILVSKRNIRWVGYASNFMDSLVLLDGGKCVI